MAIPPQQAGMNLLTPAIRVVWRRKLRLLENLAISLVVVAGHYRSCSAPEFARSAYE